MSNPLAPCPGCGGDVQFVSSASDIGRHAVQCRCGWSGPWVISEAEAIAEWNRRAMNDQTEALAQWMHARGIATGHGETVADLLTQLSLDYRRAPALRWRSEPPDVAGLWLVCHDPSRPELIHVDDPAFYTCRPDAWPDWQWFGPIPEPEERVE